jgi:peptide/nickel transport system substrate-binding protein
MRVFHFFIAFFFVTVSLTISSCAKKETKLEFRSANGGKVYGGTFVYNETTDLPTLDPVQIGDVASHHASHQIYELLLDLDHTTLQIVPELATRWEVSPDGLTYTFNLRDSVYFHDDICFPQGEGRKFTADDVKFSFERACNPKTQTKGFWVFKDKVVGANEYFEAQQSAEPKVNDVRGFEVLDERRFRIRLTKPYAPFLMQLTSAFCYIVPPEAVKYYNQNFRMHPVGTGAFQFQEFRDGQLLLKRNPKYWQKDEYENRLPFLDNVKMLFIRDLSTQMMTLKQGGLSESFRIESAMRSEWLTEQNALAEKYDSDFVLHRTPSLSTQFYGMNCKIKPFSDKRVRLALNYAIDREKIERYVLKGEGVAATKGIVPPLTPNYDTSKVKGYKLDVQKAQQLLSEAGYPNGKGFPEITLQLNAGGGRNLKMAEAIQEMLQQNLNIKVTLMQVEWSMHLESMETGKAAFYRLGWVADYPDAENFLNQYYGKLVPAKLEERSYPNIARYQNSKFDELYEKSLAITNDAQRNAVYVQAEQIAFDEAPLLLTIYDIDERIVRKEVRDYPVNAMDRRDFKAIWLNKPMTDAKE